MEPLGAEHRLYITMALEQNTNIGATLVFTFFCLLSLALDVLFSTEERPEDIHRWITC